MVYTSKYFTQLKEKKNGHGIEEEEAILTPRSQQM